MRKLLIAFALLACTPPCEQPLRGQSPTVGKESGGNKKDNTNLGTYNPRPSQAGTKDAPLVVDVIGRPKTDSEAAEDKRNEDHKALIDAWTIGAAVAAVAVAVFTGILVLIGYCGVRAANRTLVAIRKQGVLMKRQGVLMARQTKVMEEQARILINGERAWVLVDKPRSTPFWERDPAPGYFSFDFDLINHGKTVARLMDFRAEVHYLKTGESLPTSPAEYTQLTPDDPVNGRVLAPGQILPDMSFPLIELHTPPTLEAVLAGVQTVYFCAFVRYLDFTEAERILRFCYKFGGRPAGYAWLQTGGSEYNRHT